jgi:hypothetical protein
VQVTAEIRWFWRDDESQELVDWFASPTVHDGQHAAPPGRVDRYLVDKSQVELGIKARGGRDGVEIKGLVDARAAELESGVFAGPIEIWSKWWTDALFLDTDLTVAIGKRRWMRAFDLSGTSPVDATEHVAEWFNGTRPIPSRGCNVEVTRVAVPDGQVWWTMGFEAYGPLSTVAADVSVAADVMATRRPPEMPGAKCQSYPAWLASI